VGRVGIDVEEGTVEEGALSVVLISASHVSKLLLSSEISNTVACDRIDRTFFRSLSGSIAITFSSTVRSR